MSRLRPRARMATLRGMRLAILMNLAPRKLGSFEGWIAAMCQIAGERGHQVDVYGRDPAHPEFTRSLASLGAGWRLADELLESAYRGIRRLARYDVVHLNMFAPRSRMALMAYAAYPAKILFVDHTSGPVPGEARPERPAVVRLRRALDAVTVLRLEGVAGVSQYVAERNRRRYALSAHKVRAIYNGVDVRRFVPGDELFGLPPQAPAPRPGRDLEVLTVCHLIRQKGVDFLIRGVALAKNRALRLVVVGDGPEQGRLSALAAELGIAGRVQMVGLRDDVPALLGRADLFVHPAIWEEAFGLTIAEAMLNARPVIATRIGGIPELVEHGRTGLLVAPKSAEEIAGALDLLSGDPALRARLGGNARQRATERFSLARCAAEHVDWCEEALGGSALHGPRATSACPSERSTWASGSAS